MVSNMRYVVEDPGDDRLADYVRLRDSQLRRSLETERGIFIAEGEKIIRRAAEAGCRPRSFMLQERWLPGLADVLETWPDVPCYVVSGALAEEVSGFHVHRGALAAFDRPVMSSWETVLTGSRVLVCEGLADHANAGGIMRVAAALDWDAVVICPSGADPLYRRAIKASMGVSLSLPWRRMDDATADLARLKDAGFQLVASSLGPGAVPLEECRVGDKVAVLLGSEGHGLSELWLAAADQVVTIPMADGVDSLNVTTAAAIFAYELRSR